MTSIKNILVTGGCGFIGSHLSLLLKKKKFNVTVIDNLSIGKKKLFKGSKFYNLDLSNLKELDKVFKNNNFDLVYHLAGLSNVAESNTKKAIYKRNNIKSTKNLIELIKKYNVNKFIFSSSASVYGIQKKFPIKENALLSPISYYGKTKLICEKIIKKNSSKNTYKSICLRYFNVLGCDFKNKLGEVNNPPIHLIPIFIRNILQNKEVKLRNNFKTKDRTGIRDYVHVEDIVNAHYKCLDGINKIKHPFIAINLGSRVQYSSKEILEFIKKKFDNKGIKVSFTNKKKGEPDKLLASNNLAKKILKWSPKKNIKNSILDMIKWEKYKLKKNYKFY